MSIPPLYQSINTLLKQIDEIEVFLAANETTSDAVSIENLDTRIKTLYQPQMDSIQRQLDALMSLIERLVEQKAGVIA